jgi:striatin 1/3/4
MKSRVGKLEGDGRTSKRLQESLGKHIKILENALRREREKAKAPQADAPSEGKKEDRDSDKEKLKASSKRGSSGAAQSFMC